MSEVLFYAWYQDIVLLALFNKPTFGSFDNLKYFPFWNSEKQIVREFNKYDTSQINHVSDELYNQDEEIFLVVKLKEV